MKINIVLLIVAISGVCVSVSGDAPVQAEKGKRAKTAGKPAKAPVAPAGPVAPAAHVAPAAPAAHVAPAAPAAHVAPAAHAPAAPAKAPARPAAPPAKPAGRPTAPKGAIKPQAAQPPAAPAPTKYIKSQRVNITAPSATLGAEEATLGDIHSAVRECGGRYNYPQGCWSDIDCLPDSAPGYTNIHCYRFCEEEPGYCWGYLCDGAACNDYCWKWFSSPGGCKVLYDQYGNFYGTPYCDGECYCDFEPKCTCLIGFEMPAGQCATNSQNTCASGTCS